MSREILLMLANPLIASPPHNVSDLKEEAKGAVDNDTIRNVKAVVHVMEQLIMESGGRDMEGEDFRGLHLILQCIDHALEYELSKEGAS